MSDFPIYTGLWINRSYVTPVGWTLTLSCRDAALFISGIAVIIVFAGDRAWTIAAFLLHQSRAPVRDTTNHQISYRQKNVCLRNSTSAVPLILELSKMGKGPDPSDHDFMLRTFGLTLWPLLVFFFFSAAAIVSAFASTADSVNSTFIVESTLCGLYNMPYYINPISLQEKFANDTRNARAYSAQCSWGHHVSFSCAHYPKQFLELSTASTLDCAFGNRCVHGWDETNVAFSVWSNFIDSHEDLGINAPRKDRIQVQKALNCSVLNPEGLTVSDEESTSYIFGHVDSYQSNDDPSSSEDTTFVYNASWAQNTVFGLTTSWVLASSSDSMSTNEALRSVVSGPGYTGIWTPIPDFVIPGADTSVHFLTTNGLKYSEPNGDPWFSASEFVQSQQSYASDSDVQVMGCTESYQWRNPVTGETTQADGLYKKEYTQLDLNEQQLTSSERIFLALTQGTVHQTLITQQGDGLEANLRTQGLTGNYILNDQWKTEVTRWFEISMALLQANILDYPTNSWYPSSPDLEVVTAKFISDESPNEWEAQCNQQLVRNIGGYQNFSALGLIVILILSGLIIFISFIPKSWIFKLPPYGKDCKWYEKRDAWEEDGNLSLLDASVSEPVEARSAATADGQLEDADHETLVPSRTGSRHGQSLSDIELQQNLDGPGIRQPSPIDITYDDSLLHANREIYQRDTETGHTSRRIGRSYNTTPSGSPISSATPSHDDLRGAANSNTTLLPLATSLSGV